MYSNICRLQRTGLIVEIKERSTPPPPSPSLKKKTHDTAVIEGTESGMSPAYELLFSSDVCMLNLSAKNF